MVNVNMITRIEQGLYYASCINVKGMFNVESRNATLQVKCLNLPASLRVAHPQAEPDMRLVIRPEEESAFQKTDDT